MTSIFHVSDLHFGHPAMPEQIDAIEEEIRKGGYDVVAISGDLSQRARSGELLRGRAFIRDVSKASAVITVPGNHDVRWWHAPLGVGNHRSISHHYRKYISEDLDPVLRVPGVSFVGLNTAHGVTPGTLTWRLKDISIIGALTTNQLQRARQEFARSPRGDCRVIVMHHNPMKGELSGRRGLARTDHVMAAFAEMEVELVLCGHDHQEAIHFVENTKRGTVISTAGTVSSRSRGGRPGSVNIIRIYEETMEVATHIWSETEGAFREGPKKVFARGGA